MAFDPTSLSNYSDILNDYHAKYDAPGNSGWNSGQLVQNANRQIGKAVDNFGNLFQNFVGRAPTQDEINQFSQGFLSNSSNGSNLENNPTQYRNDATQFISDNFQQAAKDTATQNLAGQNQQAQSLGDLFRTQGRQAISSTEGMLQDYQSRLFDRLRPQLITSLQAQGLLNTGGLNEAMAGAQKDLAAGAQGFLANANLQNENQANQISFGGASAPYLYQQQQYQQQVPYLQSQGAGALDFANNQFLQNQSFQAQMALLNQQGQIQSNLQNNGFNFGNNFSKGFGGGLGQGLGNAGPNIGSAALSSLL